MFLFDIAVYGSLVISVVTVVFVALYAVKFYKEN